MRSRVFLSIFAVILVLTIVSSFFRWDFPIFHFMAKPAIMSSLLVYFLARTNRRFNGLKLLVIGAIVFSLLGDVFLMSTPSETNFMLGLGSFLAAHVLYSWAFAIPSHRPIEIPFIRRYMWVLFLVVIYGYWMFTQLQKEAGPMLLPVTVYIVVISVMFLLAFNRAGKVGDLSFRWAVVGAFLFIVSDSLLAWDMFLEEIPFSPIVILGTYGLAQLLIISGMAEQVKEVK